MSIRKYLPIIAPVLAAILVVSAVVWAAETDRRRAVEYTRIQQASYQARYSELYNQYIQTQRQIDSLQSQMQVLQAKLNAVHQAKERCIYYQLGNCVPLYQAKIDSLQSQVDCKQSDATRLQRQSDQIRLEMERLKH